MLISLSSTRSTTCPGLMGDLGRVRKGITAEVSVASELCSKLSSGSLMTGIDFVRPERDFDDVSG